MVPLYSFHSAASLLSSSSFIAPNTAARQIWCRCTTPPSRRYTAPPSRSTLTLSHNSIVAPSHNRIVAPLNNSILAPSRSSSVSQHHISTIPSRSVLFCYLNLKHCFFFSICNINFYC
uniref:Uncharacterized protein n=1 Tax=Manihot esculenta TaxID=3983 RepID=A0A2C9WEZ2_MANES